MQIRRILFQNFLKTIKKRDHANKNDIVLTFLENKQSLKNELRTVAMHSKFKRMFLVQEIPLKCVYLEEPNILLDLTLPPYTKDYNVSRCYFPILLILFFVVDKIGSTISLKRGTANPERDTGK